MNIVDQINAIADKIANEGMTVRASEVRAGAIEIRRLQIEAERTRAYLDELAGMFRETQFRTTELDQPNYEVLRVIRKALRINQQSPNTEK